MKSELQRKIDYHDQQSSEELILADIGLDGKLGNWTFTRRPLKGYWEADAAEGRGLPLDVANALHERAYPIEGGIKTYGQIVRVAGHAGSPPPEEWAKEHDGVRRVQTYHIDNAVGLKEFARVLKTL